MMFGFAETAFVVPSPQSMLESLQGIQPWRHWLAADRCVIGVGVSLNFDRERTKMMPAQESFQQRPQMPDVIILATERTNPQPVNRHGSLAGGAHVGTTSLPHTVQRLRDRRANSSQ
jgi:hypothetical protein